MSEVMANTFTVEVRDGAWGSVCRGTQIADEYAVLEPDPEGGCAVGARVVDGGGVVRDGKQRQCGRIHALVDSEGLPMRVVVHSAAIQDRDGAGLVPHKIRQRFPWLELIWADGGSNAWQVEAAVAKAPRLRMAIVKRSDDKKGFVVLPHRWVVERTLAWFGRNRRLAKDFENLAETLATFVTLASIQLAPKAACEGVGRALNKNWVELMARFPRPGPSDLCRFGEETSAGASSNGSNAP
jgi:transposase